ncbi:Dyp-type peroxidase [Gordonia sp. TBRC 11910]|uniref:Dyp-type peroxidase n=1 Tax=Gordonia asplenii TaxID=2725283 RepID=A0A848L8X1_9ACTN|nr:Dyp-type peroxidase [Gordonia asplenii]NMO05213.1 Dyp-type peroxidase [Gordonia asplenii]
MADSRSAKDPDGNHSTESARIHSTEPAGADIVAGPGPADRGISRRSLLRRGLFLGGAAAVGAGVAATVDRTVAKASDVADDTVDFHGVNQAGVVTDTQQHTVLAAFDVTNDRRDHVVEVLRRWTALAAPLTRGESVTVPIYTPADATSAYADTTQISTTSDSLEAWQAGANRLTVTVGFGRSLFQRDGKDRFGLAGRMPTQLVELPHFPGDQLIPDQSDGDLFLQACGDDQQSVFHAVRAIARVAPDIAALRWTQFGYSPSNRAGTPRNLMGFKDGTVNSNAHPPSDLDATLWAGSDSPGWMAGGTYLVYRRIRMALEHWDRLRVEDQEQVVGRHKVNGAPLGGAHEMDALDLNAKGADGGSAVIPATAHVRLAAPESNDGAVIVRRAFAYSNGTTPFTERWPPWRQALEYDAGLLFLGYQRDPRTAFIPINTRLAVNDALNQFTTHTASGVFAIPPGAVAPGHWIGETLFD